MSQPSITRLEATLGRLLLSGVVCSATFLVAGLVLWMIGAIPGIANVLLNLGLIVLIATPILRVIVSLAEYVRLRDWFFVATTVAVLTVLFVSVWLALRHQGG